jgi:hypothetical protein
LCQRWQTWSLQVGCGSHELRGGRGGGVGSGRRRRRRKRRRRRRRRRRLGERLRRGCCVPAGPPTSVGRQPGPIPRFAGVARLTEATLVWFPDASFVALPIFARTPVNFCKIFFQIVCLFVGDLQICCHFARSKVCNWLRRPPKMSFERRMWRGTEATFFSFLYLYTRITPRIQIQKEVFKEPPPPPASELMVADR